MLISRVFITTYNATYNTTNNIYSTISYIDDSRVSFEKEKWGYEKRYILRIDISKNKELYSYEDGGIYVDIEKCIDFALNFIQVCGGIVTINNENIKYNELKLNRDEVLYGFMIDGMMIWYPSNKKLENMNYADWIIKNIIE